MHGYCNDVINTENSMQTPSERGKSAKMSSTMICGMLPQTVQCCLQSLRIVTASLRGVMLPCVTVVMLPQIGVRLQFSV